jgi:hypothetical protein
MELTPTGFFFSLKLLFRRDGGMVDTQVSKTCDLTIMPVRVRLPAPKLFDSSLFSCLRISLPRPTK